MDCPNCSRENIVTLSICPSCGAMVNDSVREELALRITRLKERSPLMEPARPEKVPHVESNFASSPAVPKALAFPEIKLNPAPKHLEIQAKIPNKVAEKTNLSTFVPNETLIEFQSPRATIPEWRLMLKNVAQQRRRVGNTSAARLGIQTLSGEESGAYPEATADPIVTEIEFDPQTDDPILGNALRRIEKSRSKYYVENAQKENNLDDQVEDKLIVETPSMKSPLPATTKFIDWRADSKLPVKAKPEATPAQKIDKPNAKFANKIFSAKVAPELIDSQVHSSFEKSNGELIEIRSAQTVEIAETVTEPHVLRKNNKTPQADNRSDEFEDMAPFSLRFNSGIFDLLVGLFGSMIVLAPFFILGVDWFTTGSLFIILGTFAIVMFGYLTLSVGFCGKTFGMHLFSLEMIDIDGENYPTSQQAAVSASVFLLSLCLGGIGFVTSLFEKDRRAAHELASGTIIVKEI